MYCVILYSYFVNSEGSSLFSNTMPPCWIPRACEYFTVVARDPTDVRKTLNSLLFPVVPDE